MKKKLVAFILSTLMVLSLVGCSNSTQQDAPQTPSKTVERFSLATGGTGGTYYPIGSGIAATVTKYAANVEMNAEATGGSVANIQMAQDKGVDFLLSSASTAFAGFDGQDPFEKPVDTLRGITALYPETFQFVVLDNSGIKTISDLKGKKVAVGAPGSGTERSAKRILEYHGLTYDDIEVQYLGFGEAVTSLKDRLTDCAIVGSGIPTSSVVDAAATLEIDLLDIDPNVVDKLVKDNPYYTVDMIPAGVYKGVEKDVVAIATPALLIVRDEVSNEAVYEIVKSIYENIEEIRSVHTQGNSIKIENALNGMSVPLHPGAEIYYKEVGIIK